MKEWRTSKYCKTTVFFFSSETTSYLSSVSSLTFLSLVKTFNLQNSLNNVTVMIRSLADKNLNTLNYNKRPLFYNSYVFSFRSRPLVHSNSSSTMARKLSSSGSRCGKARLEKNETYVHFFCYLIVFSGPPFCLRSS